VSNIFPNLGFKWSKDGNQMLYVFFTSSVYGFKNNHDAEH